MGHWEQIGRDNREERARRAALPAWRRALRRRTELVLVAVAWLAGAIGALVFIFW